MSGSECYLKWIRIITLWIIVFSGLRILPVDLTSGLEYCLDYVNWKFGELKVLQSSGLKISLVGIQILCRCIKYITSVFSGFKIVPLWIISINI